MSRVTTIKFPTCHYCITFFVPFSRQVHGTNLHHPRRPVIKIQHLQQLFQFISSSGLHHHYQEMLRSAVTLAFFGFLCSSEYTSPSLSTYVANSTLLFSDVSNSNNLSSPFKLNRPKPIHLKQAIPLILVPPVLLYVLFVLCFNLSMFLVYRLVLCLCFVIVCTYLTRC